MCLVALGELADASLTPNMETKSIKARKRIEVVNRCSILLSPFALSKKICCQIKWFFRLIERDSTGGKLC